MTTQRPQRDTAVITAHVHINLLLLTTTLAATMNDHIAHQVCAAFLRGVNPRISGRW